jgi:hypothetical protein
MFSHSLRWMICIRIHLWNPFCDILVRTRTIPTEWPPLVGEVSANFCGQRVSRGQRNGSPRPLISGFKTEEFLDIWLNIGQFQSKISTNTKTISVFCFYLKERWKSFLTKIGYWKQHDDFQCVFRFCRRHQEQLKNFPEERDLVHLI